MADPKRPKPVVPKPDPQSRLSAADREELLRRIARLESLEFAPRYDEVDATSAFVSSIPEPEVYSYVAAKISILDLITTLEQIARAIEILGYPDGFAYRKTLELIWLLKVTQAHHHGEHSPT